MVFNHFDRKSHFQFRVPYLLVTADLEFIFGLGRLVQQWWLLFWGKFQIFFSTISDT